METELTRLIKKSIVSYKPILGNMRTVRYAYEVWTETGIVDVIRFEDYIIDEENYIYCGAEKEGKVPNELTCKKCKPKKCSGCIYRRTNKNVEYGILTTCFEIKISVSDFHSSNGHNFVGNKNYYVVPDTIVKKIIPFVPEDIGVIQYNISSGTFRLKKECAVKNVEEETLIRLLYNSMKKWVDKYNNIE